jgi:hypothetical protein
MNFGGFPGTAVFFQKSALSGKPDNSFFPENWWNDPFTPNLI